MVSSHRRVSRKTLRLTGQKMMILSALGVAVVVVFVAGQIRADRPANPPHSSTNPACMTEAAANQLAAPCAVDRYDAQDKVASLTSESSMSVFSDSRSAGLKVQPQKQPAATAHGSMPALALADLCAAGLGRTEFRCRAGFRKTNNVTAAVDADRSPGHEIRGQITAADGLGAPGVTVLATSARLYGDGIEPRHVLARYLTESDPAGAYSFTDLPDGEYVLRTPAHGPYAAARIGVRAGVQNADIMLVETDGVIVAGQVRTDAGEPLEGVTVLPIVVGVPSVTTDADGHFEIPVTLKPGSRSLALRFQRPGYAEQSVSLHAEQLQSDTVSLDVAMEAIDYWTAVSGRVVAPDGSPLAGRSVQLRPAAEPRIYRTTTSEEGVFSFPAVEAPAAYRLIVAGAPDHRDIDRRIDVTVDHTYFDIELEPFEFGEISGQLVNLDGAPIPDFNLVLRSTASSTPNALVTSDADGYFLIPEAPAGELVVASQSTPAILVQGVRLEAGSELHVPIVLDWGSHELRGLVVDRHGHPVPASRIILSWTHEADGIRSRTTRRTRTDAYGHFTFSRLGPGPHALSVDAPGFRTAALNHDSSREGYELTVRLN